MLLWLLFPFLLPGGEDRKILLNETFDAQIPGEIPKGWGYFPKRHTEDFRYISNVKCVSKPNSLLLDFDHFQPASRGSKAEGHNYFGVFLPPLTDGQAELSFCVYVASGGLSMEILARDTGILYYIEIGEFLQINDSKWSGCGRFGPLRKHTWYRVTLLLPTKNGRRHEAGVRLDERDAKGVFHMKQQGLVLSPKLIVKGAYWWLRFNGVGKAKLYFDDICLKKKQDI